MKAGWIIISVLALMVISSGHALTTKAPLTETPGLELQKDQALAPEALAKKSGCFECHSIDKNVVGPAYHEVAKRYKSDAKARAALIEKVKKGGKGNWTEISREVPMPPYSGRLSAADITRLVDWILSLLQQTETAHSNRRWSYEHDKVNSLCTIDLETRPLPVFARRSGFVRVDGVRCQSTRRPSVEGVADGVGLRNSHLQSGWNKLPRHV